MAIITTTLKALRDHKACVSGYNRLACHVTGNAYAEFRKGYVRYRYNEPISLFSILLSNGIDDALWALRACPQTPEMVRAERLFAVWCARQVPQLMNDERIVEALNVAEKHANGCATDDELTAARVSSWGAASLAALDVAWAAAWNAAFAAARDTDKESAREAQSQMFIKVFCGDSINLEPMLTTQTFA